VENDTQPVDLPAVPDPTTLDEQGASGLHPHHAEQVASNIKASVSDNTVRAYKSDIDDFNTWCQHYGYNPMPATPAVVAAYISELVDPPDDRKALKPATIDRRLAAIGRDHTTKRHKNPCSDEIVRTARIGLRKRNNVVQTRKTALSIDDLRAIIRLMDPDKPSHIRDKAILLLGFTTAMRRSELAALTVDELESHAKGLLVLKRRSKTDQEAEGKHIEVGYGKYPETCAVLATREWLNHAALTSGPVFVPINKGGAIGEGHLSGRGIARIVKKYVAQIGHTAGDFAGHSLRRGFATEAAKKKVPDRIIAQTTGHASTRSLDP